MKTAEPASGKRTTSNRYLFRLIWLSCISACILVILAGITYYQFSVSRLNAQFRDAGMDHLEQAKYRVEGMLKTIELEAWRLSNSPAIRNSFSAKRFEDEIMARLDIIRSIDIMKSSNAAIDEIIYYNASSDTIISSEAGYVLSNRDYPEMKSDIDYAMDNGREAGWMYLPSSVRKGNVTFVFLLPHVYGGQVRGAIIIHVKEQRLANELWIDSAANVYTDSFVMDSRGTVLISAVNKSLLRADMNGSPLYSDIMRESETAGIRIKQGERGDTMIFFLRTGEARTYIFALPVHEIAKQTRANSLFILYAMTVLIAVGILMSVITSRLAYSPIDKLVHKGKRVSNEKIRSTTGSEIDYIASCLDYLNEQSKSLNEYMKKIEPTLQELFLQKVVKREIFQHADIQAEARALHIPESRLYVVIAVVLENMHQESRFLPGEYPIISFAIRNVMAELLQKTEELDGYLLAGDDKEQVALLHVAADRTPEQLVRLSEMYARSVTEVLNQYLSFRVSIGVGRPQQSLAQTPTSYQEALLALQYRMYKTTNAVFYIEHEEQRKKNTMRIYPTKLEAQIIGELDKGDLKQAVEYFHAFSAAIRITESYNFVYQCYHVLLSSIVRSCATKGITLIDVVEDNLFDQLRNRRTAEEIIAWFIDVLFPLYCRMTEEDQEHQARLSVQKVCLYIGEHLRDVSLAECAQLVGCSPSYLSRLFMREVGCSFIDYVTRCKVDEAKRLLKESELSVAEIAHAVGYSERNLNRAFQKWVNKTPKQYRLYFSEEYHE